MIGGLPTVLLDCAVFHFQRGLFTNTRRELASCEKEILTNSYKDFVVGGSSSY